MAISFGQVVFGLREIKVFNVDGTSGLSLPASMMLHFTERFQTEEFTIEGIVRAVKTFSIGIDWEMEAGILDLGVLAKLTGRNVVSAGSTPSRTVTFDGDTGQDFPYVRIYGRAADDSIGDVHCRIWKAKLTNLEGTMRNGQFWVTSAAGVGISDSSNGSYEFVQHETAVTL